MTRNFTFNSLLWPVSLLTFCLSQGTLQGAPAEAGTSLHAQNGVLFTTPLANLPGQRLTSVLLHFPPGQKLTPHRHPGAAYVYVLKGAVRLGVEGQPVQVVHAGESFFEPPGALHVIGESDSPTQTAEALAVIVAPDGAPLSIVDK